MWTVILIFVINIVYVSLSTFRMILTFKGYRYIAAFVSMVEVVVYVVGLGLVLQNLSEIQNVIAYALGFGVGIIVGTKLEERLALGYTMVNVITVTENNELANILRNDGYGVTVWDVSGREGGRQEMQILTPRKDEGKLYARIKEVEPRAFMISYEPKTIHGGFWVKRLRKGKLYKDGKKDNMV
ncbi:DUF2179 domain-containing protein [Chungangia koreensis]|uniref:UPF0316 protein ACFOZY_06150 n=1 Tax=Chungangia koreensis TaxID=752657 RepID=A0ABV8X6W8_9LACT